jgi:hypothetical protein
MAMTEEERKAKKSAYQKQWYRKNHAAIIKKAKIRRDRVSLDPALSAQRKATQNRWRAANPEKIKAISEKARRRYMLNNRDKAIMRQRQHSQLMAANMTDSYIRNIISKNNIGLKTEYIPQDLINLKRQQLRIKRILRERKQNGKHSRTN